MRSLATEWLKRWQLGAAAKVLTRSRNVRDGIEAWLAGVGLRALAADWDIQRTRAFLNRHGHRNGGRVLSKSARFLPAGTAISALRLFEIYQGSVERPLRAA